MGLGIDTTRKFFKSNKYLDPIKENILNLKKSNQSKFNFLQNEYSKLDINVYNLTDIMQDEATKYLKKDEFLFWRDDTHWNQNGILVAKKYIKDIIGK